VLEEYGYLVCEVEGCDSTDHLEAHHLRPGDNDPATGRLLCRRHHGLIDKDKPTGPRSRLLVDDPDGQFAAMPRKRRHTG
jgi:hypothetical protein